MTNQLLVRTSLIFLISCQHTSHREPASLTPNNPELIQQLYQVDNKILKLEDLKRRYKDMPSHLNELDAQLSDLDLEKSNLIKQSNNSTQFKPLSTPEIYELHFKNPMRNFSRKLIFEDFSKYEVTKDGQYKQFIVDLHSTTSYQLDLYQQLQPHHVDGQTPEPLKAHITCEGPFKFKKYWTWGKYQSNEVVKFDWYQSESNFLRVELKLSPKSKHCLLTFTKPDDSTKNFALEFVSEESLYPKLSSFINRFEYCQMPRYTGSNTLDALYLNTSYRSMSCPRAIQNIRTLENPIDGINAKVFALLGQNLPAEMISKQDPYFPLDFSKAPQLDAIYISYLVFRRDFYGTVMERLLRFHAKNKARIKILVSEVISLDKDKEMLIELERDFSNITVQFYKFDPFGPRNLKEQLSKIHRTMHVKLFLTYSSSNPENSVAVVGGRNIHDGFVYDKKPDLSRYPKLIQYGEGLDEGFAKWTDFEIELRGQEMVESLIGHYHSVFEYDNQDFFFRNYSLNKNVDSILSPDFLNTHNKILVRHFTSSPYKDDMALERFMSDLIDSAKENITITTPYFNLTKNLQAAFIRAVERGVKIELITRLELEGDTADIILSDVNKAAVNKFSKSMTIYEFTKKSDILHSKLFLVDGKITLIGSINLNQRSFYHDIENTLIINSKEFNKKMKSIIESYKKTSTQITQKQKTIWWKTIIIQMLKQEL